MERQCPSVIASYDVGNTQVAAISAQADRAQAKIATAVPLETSERILPISLEGKRNARTARHIGCRQFVSGRPAACLLPHARHPLCVHPS